MFDILASFLIAAFALTGSPGPNTLSVAAVGASFGRLKGFEYMLGLSAGVGLVIVIVGTGISGAILAIPGLAPVITGAAVLYFLYLAWRIATAPPLSALPDENRPRAPRWYAGVLLSLSNPKAYAAMGALFSGYTLLPGAPVEDGLTKAAIVMGVILIVNFLWLSIGATLARTLQHPRASRAVNIAFAVLLLASVALVAFR
ncbi:LysE family translocator [Roseovarius sp.]|uniref:LysE family translocator n=1 Tax=Roseovarius sp. TaxID=1486281 RepID=UPI003BACB88D